MRLDPKNDMTRYNLELCKRQKKQQDKQQQNKKQSQKEKNDGENKQDTKDQKKDEQQKQNQNKDKMSKDNAEQLLNAAIQQEKSTQERMKKAMQQPRSRKLEKNW